MQNNNYFNFWRSFFGQNPNQDGRFIDQWNNNSFFNRVWGQKTAVWVDTGQAFELYVTIPELRAAVNKRAQMMSGNKPVLVDADGQKVDNHWLLDLIKQPNPTQNWGDVVFCLSVNDALYSNAFAYSPKRSFEIRNLFLPLPSDKVKIKLSGKTLRQMDAEGLIQGFGFCYDSDIEEDLTFDEIVYFNTPDGMNIVNPSSRLEALKYPLSNIKASYHKRNVLLENIGAIGILSAKNSDIGGAIPLSPEDKEKIRKDWFARQKDELIITEADVNWQPMSYPTKDLLLFEELNADKLALLDAFGLSQYVFGQESGATFSNVRDGIRLTYTDTIIPETQKLYDSIIQQFGLDAEGFKLIADFSHIAVLQADENLKARAMNTRADAVKKIIDAGVTLSEYEIRELILPK